LTTIPKFRQEVEVVVEAVVGGVGVVPLIGAPLAIQTLALILVVLAVVLIITLDLVPNPVTILNPKINPITIIIIITTIILAPMLTQIPTILIR